MEIKQLDSEGKGFLIQEEGKRLKPYFDSKGVATIGIGNTYYEDGTRVKITDPPISEQRMITLFDIVLKPYEMLVWSVTRDDITQNNFNALVSIAYNIGQTNFRQSTLLRRVNAKASDEEIRAAFVAYKYSAGKPILLERRKREFELYVS